MTPLWEPATSTVTRARSSASRCDGKVRSALSLKGVRRETEMMTMRKKKVLCAAAFVASAAAAGAGVRRFGPTLAERGMKQCQQMGHMSQECPPEETVQGHPGGGREDSELVYLGEEQTSSLAATT